MIVIGKCANSYSLLKHMTAKKPTIIKQVGELEQQYNAKRFTRGRNNNRLTDLGLQLMPLCRSIINGVKEIDE